MYTYSLIANSTSIQRSDGAVIPNDMGNTDYLAYIAWSAAGNVVAPVNSNLTLAQMQSLQSATLSAACQAAITAGFTSSALGAPYTYPAQSTDQLNLNSAANAAGVALGAPVWTAGAAHAAGNIITPVVGQPFICTTGGNSSGTAQNWNVAVGASVDDGSCVWQIWVVNLWCENAAGEWALTPHTASQARQVGMDGFAAVSSKLYQNQALQLQVAAAITTEAVQAIVWPTA